MPGQARSWSWPTGEDATVCARRKRDVPLREYIVGEVDTGHRIERNLEKDWIEEWKLEAFLDDISYAERVGSYLYFRRSSHCLPVNLPRVSPSG
jgi:hypothetical protein